MLIHHAVSPGAGAEHSMLSVTAIFAEDTFDTWGFQGLGHRKRRPLSAVSVLCTHERRGRVRFQSAPDKRFVHFGSSFFLSPAGSLWTPWTFRSTLLYGHQETRG